MNSQILPDINVWLALASSLHIHHRQAKAWFDSLKDEELVFCRFTQLGLLRLLTTPAVMGSEVLTQRQAWQIYESFLQKSGAVFVQEPRTLDESFRRLTRMSSASSKDWADSYLAAFAAETGAKLVTFDKALAAKTKDSILL